MSPELAFEVNHADTEEQIDLVLDVLYGEVDEGEHAINMLLERKRKLES